MRRLYCTAQSVDYLCSMLTKQPSRTILVYLLQGLFIYLDTARRALIASVVLLYALSVNDLHVRNVNRARGTYALLT